MIKKLLCAIIFVFVVSCGSQAPQQITEEAVVVEEPSPQPPTVDNTKFGYVLVPGMDLRETDRGILLVLENPVNFKFNKYDIQPQYDASFTVVDNFVNANDNILQRLVVEGHTDNIGTEKYNIGLSERRALSGVNKSSDVGVSRAIMRTSALGEMLPSYSGSNSYLNRRLDFIIMSNQEEIDTYNSFVSNLMK